MSPRLNPRLKPRLTGQRSRRSVLLLAAGTLLSSTLAQAQLPQPDGGPVQPGSLPAAWRTGGPKCMEQPEWQVHEYNPHFFILRQSGCTDYEKPFLYLIFGKDRALLFDTGSREGHPVPVIRRAMHEWLLRNHRDAMPLLVTHSHSHGDHVAGDAELRAFTDPAVPVTVIPATVDATKALYGIKNWPEDIGHVDLGDRVLDVVPIPGHDTVSIALYDRQTGILLTGDSAYPGRLYIRDLDAFTRSNERLIRFTEGKVITHVLGCHIEQSSTPYKDYPVGTMYQPHEHSLELSRGALLEIQAGLLALHGLPKRVAYRDFSLWPVGPAFRSAGPSEAEFEAGQKRQRERMWDQTAPETATR